MPRHQRHQLMASEKKDRVAANKQRVWPVLGDCCKSLVEVVFATCIDRVDYMKVKSMRAHRGFRLPTERIAHLVPQETAALQYFDPAYDRSGSRSVELVLFATVPLNPPEADIAADIILRRLVQ